MLTIKQIAEMANVSRTTVSRVLNDSGYVSSEARSRVLEVIKKTGYVPSQQAKSLRTKETKVIGVVLPKISTETSSRIVNGLNDVFQEEGYHILLTSTNLDHDKEIEYLKLLKSRQVDGIVLIATNTGESLINEIAALTIPIVAVGQEIPGVISVTYDDYGASMAMTRLIISKGYKKIAFIGVSEKDRSVGLLRKRGYLDASKEAEITQFVETADFSIESGYEAMKRILARTTIDNRPDAVVAVTDRIAIGAMQCLKEEGLQVPGDIALAGMGCSEISRYVTPPLTTIDFQNEAAGQEAAAKLLQMLKGNTNNQKNSILNYRIIDRESV